MMNIFLLLVTIYTTVHYSWFKLYTLSLIPFLVPIAVGLMLYECFLILLVCKLLRRFQRDNFNNSYTEEIARWTVSAIWEFYGRIWHGYEVDGMENIPQSGPCLFIYYHGAIPIDMYYLMAKVILEKNRIIRPVADRFLFKVPGFSLLAESIKAIPGSLESCSQVLKDGHMLCIAPGGVYEAQFSQDYNLMWKNRLGFAKVALDAKVPIIPVFTENCKEAYRTLGIGGYFFKKIYDIFKIPLAPIYGGIPVKLVTHLGKPIPYDSSLTPEQLRSKVAVALEDLINTHQKIPGNMFYAFLQRFAFVTKKIK